MTDRELADERLKMIQFLLSLLDKEKPVDTKRRIKSLSVPEFEELLSKVNLSPRDRECVRQIYLEHRSYVEVALNQHICEETVKRANNKFIRSVKSAQ